MEKRRAKGCWGDARHWRMTSPSSAEHIARMGDEMMEGQREKRDRVRGMFSSLRGADSRSRERKGQI